MGLKEFISGRRLRAAVGDSSDWKLTAAMMWIAEKDLPRAAQAGDLTPEELKYAQGTIELTIQGERIAKTRKQWAAYISGMEHARVLKIVP